MFSQRFRSPNPVACSQSLVVSWTELNTYTIQVQPPLCGLCALASDNSSAFPALVAENACKDRSTSVSPQKFIHSLASGWVTDEWLPSFYLRPSSQRTLSCRVVNISACHPVVTETEFLFFYTLSRPSQLPSLFNHLESKLTFLSLGTKLLSIKKKNISSYSLSFQFPCFPDPHPHPFHYPSGSFFFPWEPPSLISCPLRLVCVETRVIRSFCLVALRIKLMDPGVYSSAGWWCPTHLSLHPSGA